MLLIVGLDGASLEVVSPWVQAGKLPNLGRLLADGVSGPLRSTMPPATFPAWTTFMTGVNPGRHGIFDFAQRIPGTYSVRFLNGSQRRFPSVWRHLSTAGKRVAVFGIPGTYPPEPVNGVMVSGFDTPVTTRADASFVYPSELAAEVEAGGGFPFADFQEFRIGPEWHRFAVSSLLEGIRIKTRLAVRQLGRERWDCAMVLFGESDTVAHHFWRFQDASSPRFDATAVPELRGAMEEVYVALDVALGELTAACQPDAVLVCSDHGFGGAGKTVVHLNRQLERAGLLRWRERGALGRGAAAGKSLLLRWLPPQWQARCFRLGSGRFAGTLESAVRFAHIDWPGTQAFSEELNYFPSVWLNVQGRDPQGTVSQADYERRCDDVSAALLAMRDPESQSPIVARVWRRQELYHGPWVDLAPDLVLELELQQGYSYTCLPSHGPGDHRSVRVMSAEESRDGKLRGMSGSHRRDGMFVLGGPASHKSGVRVDLADMAPTILALCGAPVPDNLDGRVLRCLEWPCALGPSVRDEDIGGMGQPFTTIEERCLERRLQSWGYIE